MNHLHSSSNIDTLQRTDCLDMLLMLLAIQKLEQGHRCQVKSIFQCFAQKVDDQPIFGKGC